MSARRAALVVVPALLALALVPLGRWEHSRADARTLSHMRALRAFAGPSLERHLSGYRLSWDYDCLLFSTGALPYAPESLTYAVELCFDSGGRLVLAIDRRPSTSQFYSFLDQARAPALRLPLPLLLRAFHKDGALRDVPTTVHALPVGFEDAGPKPAPRRMVVGG